MATTNPQLRPIRSADNPAIAAIIRTVMPEFGASGPGFAINDDEVDCMYQTYSQPGSRYFVIADGSQVLGGGGIAPLSAVDPDQPTTCELRKMYSLPEVRGHGFGRQMLTTCLTAARELGYQRCYLETLTGMNAAQHLYQRFGFEKLCGPLGKTGHFSCDRYYLLEL